MTTAGRVRYRLPCAHRLPGAHRLREDSGVASVIAAALAGVLLLVCAGLLSVAQVALVRQRAATAADLAALAGAGRLLDGGDAVAACDRAAALASESDARLVSCRVTGLDVELTVARTVPDPAAALVRWATDRAPEIVARARAGPPPGVAGYS